MSPKGGSPEEISPKSIGKVQRAKCKVRGQSARANISAMNKKRGGSLFFMPYLCSILSALYSTFPGY